MQQASTWPPLALSPALGQAKFSLDRIGGNPLDQQHTENASKE